MKRAALAAMAMLLGGLARPAAAQPALASCETNCISHPNQVVITGSPAMEPVLRKLAPAIQKEYGVQIYYIPRVGQCLGARHLVEGLDLVGVGANFLGTLAPDAGATNRCCNLADQTKADLWIGESPIEDCLGTKPPAGYRDYLGPIAAYTIVVPRASPERAISIEEAYFVFGFGGAGFMGAPIAPWNDTTRLVIPRLLDGPRAVWARFLRFPVTRPKEWPGHLVAPDPMKGQERGDPDLILSMLSPDTGGPSAIALTTAQAYESVPGADRVAVVGYDASPGPALITVKALAVRSAKQKYAFYADSTLGSFDKRNVREGRYPLWAPLHLVLKADATGRPLSAGAEIIVNYLNQKVSTPTYNVLDAIVAGHLVPACAMKVQRKPDAGATGDLMPYTPPPGTGCGCYMDDLLSRGASGCTACSPGVACPAGKMCSNGFCE